MPRYMQIHKWPIWLLGVVSQGKSFKANPIIGSRLLNMLGLHVIRVLLAHAVTQFRWMLLRGRMPADLRAAYHRDGFVAVPAFLNEQQLAEVLDEVKSYRGEARQMLQGDTATQRFLLDRKTLTAMPAMAELVHGRRLLNFLAYGAAKARRPIFYIQRIRNGCRTSKADPQKTMHSDTFHPTMKAWLFLEDVTPEKGPFTYVRGSHRLTWKRLKWEYRRSVEAGRINDGYSEKGSFRADAEDLAEMGLPAPEGLCARAGTLVIANTNGFHGRGSAAEGKSRLELWAYSRFSPFNPLPGISSAAVLRFENRIMRAFWQHKDRQAEAKGSRATWHVIDAASMLDGI